MNTDSLAVDWIGDPYGQYDNPGIVSASGYAVGPVYTDAGQQMTGSSRATSTAGASQPSGNLLQGLLIMLVLVFAVYFAVHHVAKANDGDFANPKASFLTIFVITISVFAMVPAGKLAAGATLGKSKNSIATSLNRYLQAA